MNKTKREKGFGTLINKGANKPWLAKWVYEGKVYYKSTGEIDKKKALKVLEKLTRPFREDNKVEVLRNLESKVKGLEEDISKNRLHINSIKINDICDLMETKIEFKDITNGTMQMYQKAINSFAEFASKNNVIEMYEVDEQLIEKYLIELSDKVVSQSYNLYLGVLKRIWKLFKDEGRYNSNVFEKFKFKKGDGSIRREFTVEELSRIFDAVKCDEELLCLFSVALYTGLRFSDCANLKWSEIDIIKRTISVIPIKTKRHSTKSVVIPIHDSLFSILSLRWESKGNNEYVMPNMFSGYNKGTLRIKIYRLFKKLGIKTYDVINGKKKYICGFHSLRHTFVSMNLNSGLSPMLVQNMVGHHSLDMTRAYFHSNVNVIKNGISKMPDFIECKDYVDMTVKDSDVELLKEVFDSERDKSLSDTIKRLVNYYQEYSRIIDVAG
jgi:integrase